MVPAGIPPEAECTPSRFATPSCINVMDVCITRYRESNKETFTPVGDDMLKSQHEQQQHGHELFHG